jgi:prepilin-type processing-associated H-X9-DG protein
LLPYLEQQAAYDMIEFWRGKYYPSLGNGGGSSGVAGRTRIATYLCPSDPQEGEIITISGNAGEVVGVTGLRQTNMAGVADSTVYYCDPAHKWNTKILTGSVSSASTADGVMGNVNGCRIEDILDGSSNTLAIGEVTGGGKGSYFGYFWVTMDVTDTGGGINGIGTIPGGGSGVGFYTSGFSSFHSGGCNFLLADGSTHFVSENISTTILRDLTRRSDGNPVTIP